MTQRGPLIVACSEVAADSGSGEAPGALTPSTAHCIDLHMGWQRVRSTAAVLSLVKRVIEILRQSRDNCCRPVSRGRDSIIRRAAVQSRARQQVHLRGFAFTTGTDAVHGDKWIERQRVLFGVRRLFAWGSSLRHRDGGVCPAGCDATLTV
jgi:hypothetical protein